MDLDQDATHLDAEKLHSQNVDFTLRELELAVREAQEALNQARFEQPRAAAAAAASDRR